MTATLLAWSAALRDRPWLSALSLVGLLAGTVAAGWALRVVTGRLRSLRHLVLVITLAALAIGAVAAVVLARLMVLDDAQARVVVAVLGLTALFAVVLVLIASAPLRHDVRRLEATVRRIEDGDRHARTGLNRSDELGHVAHALDALNARLDELERERAGFEAERTTMLSNIGHDLRTPLTALRAAVEALSDGVAPDPARYLRSMQHDIDALTALVDDFFLLARIDAGCVHLLSTPVDLTEIADEAVEALTPLAAQHGVSLALSASARVQARGDAAAVGRVIRNLVDNAIRHTRPGSVVEIIVTGGARPTVQVVDDGDGFPSQFAGQAFERFTRADASRSRASGGAGLGLAIARGLVEAHGGRIWIEAPPGGKVAFDLPAA